MPPWMASGADGDEVRYRDQINLRVFSCLLTCVVSTGRSEIWYTSLLHAPNGGSHLEPPAQRGPEPRTRGRSSLSHFIGGTLHLSFSAMHVVDILETSSYHDHTCSEKITLTCPAVPKTLLHPAANQHIHTATHSRWIHVYPHPSHRYQYPP